MDRAYASGAAGSPPSAPASPSVGYPTAGNPGTGTMATKPGPYWYHMITEELLAVIVGAGLTPAPGTLTQLASAIQSGKLFSAAAGGTADALTASFAPAITALINGMSLYVRAGSANATATPSFTPASGVIAAKTIVKGAGAALAVGDIAGAGHWIELQYDQTLDKWVMLNPATGIVVAQATVVPIRQTVLSGPVDSNGYAAFGGSIGSATVTASGVLVATAANGFGMSGQIDRIGSITNPSWTGLSTNGTAYLYLDIAADGSCTPGKTMLSPVYQPGSSFSTAAGQYTFSTQMMVGKLGDGSAANQAYRVFVGECLVAGGVVTSIIWYALMGRAVVPDFALASSTTYVKSTNLGVPPLKIIPLLVNAITEAGWPVGSVVHPALQDVGLSGSATTGFGMGYAPSAQNSITFSTGSANFYLIPAGGGGVFTCTNTNWKARLIVERGW